MKTQFVTLLIFVLAIETYTWGCGSESETTQEKYGTLEVAAEYDRQISELVSESAGSDLSANTQGFAVNLMEKIIAAEGDQNIMVSPLSISLALSMTMNGADTTTLDAMLSSLDFNGVTLKEVNTYLHQIVSALEENDDVVLEIANAIWARDDYQPLKRSFYEIITDYYDAAIFPLSGVDPINGWVSDATHNKITKIIDQLPAGAALVLVNAIYFNGTWLEAFDKDQTDRQDFRSTTGTIQVDMMHNSSEEIRYKRGLDYEAVSIPYKDEKTSLYVFVPAEDSSLQAFYDNALYTGSGGGYYEHSWETDDWQWIDDPAESLFSNFIHGEVSLSLPRFSFEFKRSLKEDLKALGMGEIFIEESDFSNFAEGKNPWVDDVLHKTFIDVNEEGTEAAAVTAVVMKDGIAGFYISLDVDRPFFFCIRDEKAKAILFMGQVTNLSQ